jgi:hypothetical protein
MTLPAHIPPLLSLLTRVPGPKFFGPAGIALLAAQGWPARNTRPSWP